MVVLKDVHVAVEFSGIAAVPVDDLVWPDGQGFRSVLISDNENCAKNDQNCDGDKEIERRIFVQDILLWFWGVKELDSCVL